MMQILWQKGHLSHWSILNHRGIRAPIDAMHSTFLQMKTPLISVDVFHLNICAEGEQQRDTYL